MRKTYYSLIINLGLLLSGLLTIFSGLLIQIHYHLGNHSDKFLGKIVLGWNYFDWSYFHKFSIIILSILSVFHIYRHWKWYKGVIAKRLFNKNRQTITMTIIFVLVVITGFIPWIIDLVEGNIIIRKAFIEIHDKIAIILSIYFILHIIKRLKWFLTTIKKMYKKHGTQQSV